VTTGTYRFNGEQLSYAKPPFSYEYIAERPKGEQWRIRDSQDNAVGSSGCESGAKEGVRVLNRNLR
jgi:hypothetical protein